MQDQPKQDRRDLRAWIRDLWPLVAIIVVVNLSGGGECWWEGSTNHKKHNQNNPVMWVPEDQEIAPEDAPYLLEDYRIEPSTVADASGVPGLRDIEGTSLARAGIEDDSPARLREFTARILEVNRELLGMPEHAGALVFLRVVARGEERLVLYGHIARDGQGDLALVPGSLLNFVFGADGRLLQIASTVSWSK